MGVGRAAADFSGLFYDEEAMDTIVPTTTFSLGGRMVMVALLAAGGLAGLWGLVNLASPQPRLSRTGGVALAATNVVFVAGFVWMCWFHYQIYSSFSLSLPDTAARWINRQLALMNAQSSYSLPLYDSARPPRYLVPLWIETEKYYFWFMCYGILALIGFRRLVLHRIRAVLQLLLAAQVGILFFAADPFSKPLPTFFSEVGPWVNPDLGPMARIGLFMQLYPKMIFYYNAWYMRIHPPMLFLAYACITMTFVTSLFMLVRPDPHIELVGYDFAKLGYLLLTLGMLLGYPWALQAWGPNWWWDPKVCSALMMWSVYSTCLHTRLYLNRRGMWYFTAFLGMLCFLAMIFTFLTSYYFAGEHTLQ